jgi:hypothetical protein
MTYEDPQLEMEPGESLTSYLERLTAKNGSDGKFVKLTNLGAITQMFSRPAANSVAPSAMPPDLSPTTSPATGSTPADSEGDQLMRNLFFSRRPLPMVVEPPDPDLDSKGEET